MVTFRPTKCPASFRPARNPLGVGSGPGGAFEALLRNPTTGTAVCCPRATTGHAPPPEPCNEIPPSHRSCLLPRRQPIPAEDAGERAASLIGPRGREASRPKITPWRTQSSAPGKGGQAASRAWPPGRTVQRLRSGRPVVGSNVWAPADPNPLVTRREGRQPHCLILICRNVALMQHGCQCAISRRTAGGLRGKPPT